MDRSQALDADPAVAEPDAAVGVRDAPGRKAETVEAKLRRPAVGVLAALTVEAEESSLIADTAADRGTIGVVTAPGCAPTTHADFGFVALQVALARRFAVPRRVAELTQAVDTGRIARAPLGARRSEILQSVRGPPIDRAVRMPEIGIGRTEALGTALPGGAEAAVGTRLPDPLTVDADGPLDTEHARRTQALDTGRAAEALLGDTDLIAVAIPARRTGER